MTFVDLKQKLESQFPQYQFRLAKRQFRQCLIAKKSNYSGADIFISKDKITIEAAIPDMKRRLLLGAGALYLKGFKKDFHEPSQKIYNYLLSESHNVNLRQ